MKRIGTYGHIFQAIKEQLFASAPEEHAEFLGEQLFANNMIRFFILSSAVVLVDIGVIITQVATPELSKDSYIHIYSLLGQSAAMLICCFVFFKMLNCTFQPANFFHRSLEILYPLLYLASETAILFYGPQDIGAAIRAASITFVIGCAAIMHHARSSLFIIGTYTFVFFNIEKFDYNILYGPYITTFNFWLACFCALFLSYTVYSWFVNRFVSIIKIEQAHARLGATNEALETEVMQRAKLLNVVDNITGSLLNANPENFQSVIFSCMENVGNSVSIDHIYVWKNYSDNDLVYSTPICSWLKGLSSRKKTKQEHRLILPKEWRDALLNKKSINIVVNELPDQAKNIFEDYGVISTTIFPVVLHGSLWGVVGFDSDKNCRLFSEVEESILHTISLLFASSIIRNEMTVELVHTTEKALESSKAKTNFLANMSHEIRTPINAITGMANIARNAGEKQRVLRCLDHIDAASKQLLSIINDVLDMSKIEAGKIELTEEPFHLLKTLQNVQGIIFGQAQEKNLNLAVAFDYALPQIVIGDEMRLSQILINLLSNAIKFTPENGDVYFFVCIVQDNLNRRGNLTFTVKDTGIGIEADKQAHLFDKFEQADRGISRKYGGTGLGLAISKSLAESMGGGITLTSTPGKGSCFTVHVPIKLGRRDMLTSSDSADQTHVSDFSAFRALLVEDIELNREIVITMLKETGLHVDEAEDGKIAVDMIQADPARYDIVFMDLHMPIMDGYTATREILSIDHPKIQSLPILAMSANAFEEDIKQCLDAGMVDHVAKPIDFTMLIQKINMYLATGFENSAYPRK